MYKYLYALRLVEHGFLEEVILPFFIWNFIKYYWIEKIVTGKQSLVLSKLSNIVIVYPDSGQLIK